MSVFRWSLLFAILAAMSLHVRQIALTELRMVCPRVTIDAPSPTASVPPHFIVRGHVATDTITRPLWVVTRSSRLSPSFVDQSRAIDLLPRPVVADMFGEFAVPVDLLGRDGQRYQISIVSADELANGWLESAPAFLSLSGRLRPLAEGGHRSCVGGAMELAAATSGMTVLATMPVVLATGAR